MTGIEIAGLQWKGPLTASWSLLLSTQSRSWNVRIHCPIADILVIRTFLALFTEFDAAGHVLSVRVDGPEHPDQSVDKLFNQADLAKFVPTT